MGKSEAVYKTFLTTDKKEWYGIAMETTSYMRVRIVKYAREMNIHYNVMSKVFAKYDNTIIGKMKELNLAIIDYLDSFGVGGAENEW